MKTIKNGILAALTAVLLTALISCVQPVGELGGLTNVNKPPANMGGITLNLNKPDARTILPSVGTPTKYKITIYDEDTGSTPVGGNTYAYNSVTPTLPTVTPSNPNNPYVFDATTTNKATFYLTPGNYLIVVEAFKDSGATKMYGIKEAEVTVTLGITQVVPINLELQTQGSSTDVGVFDYNITLPSAASLTATMTLSKTSGASLSDDFSASAIDLTTGTNNVGTLNLSPGIYNVRVELSVSASFKRIIEETLQVYQNLTSSYTPDFSGIVFPSTGGVAIEITPPKEIDPLVVSGTSTDTLEITWGSTVTLQVPSATGPVTWKYYDKVGTDITLTGTGTNGRNLPITASNSTSFNEITDSTNPARTLTVIAPVGGVQLSKSFTVVIKN